MKTLSLCMIVKNEEEVIARCLDSVRFLADEIIIIDTGSTDRTVHICKNYGVKLFHFDWCDDFSAARNFAFSHASCDYILWLDADDIIEPDENQKLLQLKERLNKDIYYLYYDYYQDEYGKSVSTFYRERIVKRSLGLKWLYPIHEVLDASIASSSEYTDIEITHKRTQSGYINDRYRNLNILQTAVQSAGYKREPRIWYYLGKEYQDHGQFENAIQAYQQSVELNGWIEDKTSACFRSAQCHFELYDSDQDNLKQHGNYAREMARKAIYLDERRAEPYFVMGQMAFKEKQYDEAIFWYKKCLCPIPDIFSPIDISFYGLKPCLNLMFCYDKLGDLQQANFYNEKALEFAPNDSGLLYNQEYFKTKLGVKNSDKQAAIGWYGKTINPDYPTYRIRAINIHVTLNEMGFHSVMIDTTDEILSVESIIFFKAYTYDEYGAMKFAKDNGKTVILDIAEDLFPLQKEFPLFVPMIELADIVTCSSFKLSDKIRSFNANAHVVEDAIEVFSDKILVKKSDSKLKVGWIGMQGSQPEAESLRPIIEECGYELICIHEGPHADIKWNMNTWAADLSRCDIAIVPRNVEVHPCKSNNRVSACMALGLPVIASPLDSYKRIIHHGTNGFIASTQEEWKACLQILGNETERIKVGGAGINSALRFRRKNIALKMARIVSPAEYQKKAVDIIIPTIYNTGHLEICIQSIIACTQIPYNIIVINNGDHRQELPIEVKIIQARNLSFAQSINLGLKHSTAPYIGILNDDIIVSDGWLEPLLQEVKNGAGFCNPLSNCDKGWLHNYDIRIGNTELGPGTNELNNDAIKEKCVDSPGVFYEAFYSFFPDCIRRVYTLDWVAFFCTVTSRAIIDKVGYLDDSFVNDCEDIDLCLRAKKMGIGSMMNENSFVFHFGGTSRTIHADLKLDDKGLTLAKYRQKYEKPLLVIHAGYSFEPWNAKTIEQTGIGGSETAVVKMSEEFCSLGYKVVVFCDCNGIEGIFNNVEYKPLDSFEHFIGIHMIDVFMLSRYANILEYPIRAVRKYLWLHDVYAMGTEHGEKDFVRKHINSLDAVFCLSHWHQTIVEKVHKIDSSKIRITGNGIDTNRFQEKVQKQKNRFIYSSSPDRGLLVLLKLFPKIKNTFPDATLHIYYGFDNWNKSIRQSGNTQQYQLVTEIQNLMTQEGVYYHGRVNQNELALAFLQSDIWLYPTQFTETYCITALEAQMAETLCICSDLAGLSSTVGSRGILIDADPSNPDYETIVLGQLIEIQNNPERKSELLKKAKNWASQQTWRNVAKQWNDVFQDQSILIS